MIPLFAAMAAAAAVFIGIFTLTTPGRGRVVAGRLSSWERGEVEDRESLLGRPFTDRVGMPLLRRLGGVGGRLLPPSLLASIDRRLVLAGEPVSLHAFAAVQGATVAGAALLIVLTASRGGSATYILSMLGAALILVLIPIYWLRIRVATRKRALLRALPDAVDLIVTTVEAGLSIDAALAEVGRETKGPLGEELRLAIRESTLGSSRRDALQRLVERTGVPDLRTFVQAILQAEQTGIPLGPVLRVQAEQIRLKKRQRAETDAQRAPVKMVLVLVLLVLPAMLLTVMGPALMRLGDTR